MGTVLIKYNGTFNRKPTLRELNIEQRNCLAKNGVINLPDEKDQSHVYVSPTFKKRLNAGKTANRKKTRLQFLKLLWKHFAKRDFWHLARPLFVHTSKNKNVEATSSNAA